MRDRPPFIETQRMYLLDGEVSDPWQFLRPEAFRAARLRPAQSDKQSNVDPHTKYWHPITPEALLCDGGMRRLSDHRRRGRQVHMAPVDGKGTQRAWERPASHLP